MLLLFDPLQGGDEAVHVLVALGNFFIQRVVFGKIVINARFQPDVQIFELLSARNNLSLLLFLAPEVGFFVFILCIFWLFGFFILFCVITLQATSSSAVVIARGFNLDFTTGPLAGGCPARC